MIAVKKGIVQCVGENIYQKRFSLVTHANRYAVSCHFVAGGIIQHHYFRSFADGYFFKCRKHVLLLHLMEIEQANQIAIFVINMKKNTCRSQFR